MYLLGTDLILNYSLSFHAKDSTGNTMAKVISDSEESMMELNSALNDLMTNCELSFVFDSETVNVMQCEGELL